MSSFPEFIAYDHATKSNREYFIQNPPDTSEELAWALEGAGVSGDLELINLLLKYSQKTTLLHSRIALSSVAKGAAMVGHTDLLQGLLELGASIQVAFMAAARGQQDDLMQELLKTGEITKASAAYGYACMGEHGRLQELVKEDPSILPAAVMGLPMTVKLKEACLLFANKKEMDVAFWYVMGLYAAVSRIVPPNKKSMDLANGLLVHFQDMETYALATLTAFTHLGLASSFWHYIAVNSVFDRHPDTIPRLFDAAVKGAARGGMRTLVNQLVSDFHAEPCSALFAAMEIPDEKIVGDMLDRIIKRDQDGIVLPGRDITTALSGAFRVAFKNENQEMVTWLISYIDKRMPARNMEKRSLSFAADAIPVKFPGLSCRYLATIGNPHHRRLVAGTLQKSHWLGAATIINLSRISPEAALAFCYAPAIAMTLFLRNAKQDCLWSTLPAPIIGKIYYFIINERYQVGSLKELEKAAQIALERARENLPTPEEAESLLAIQQRIAKKNHPVKLEKLRNSTDLYSRTHALSIHRTDAWPLPEPMLPKSLKVMMKRFPHYQNLVALQQWLNEFKEEINIKATFRRRPDLIALYTQCIHQLNQLAECEEFDRDAVTSDPNILARYLQRKFQDNPTLEDLVRMVPKFWRDLEKRFPLMMSVINEQHPTSFRLHC